MISVDRINDNRAKILSIYKTYKIEFIRVIFVFSFKLIDFNSLITVFLLIFVMNIIIKIIFFNLLVWFCFYG